MNRWQASGMESDIWVEFMMVLYGYRADDDVYWTSLGSVLLGVPDPSDSCEWSFDAIGNSARVLL